MGKTFKIVLNLVCFTVCAAFSQTQVTIYTPNNNAVPDTYLRPEGTNSQIEFFDSIMTATYPNATKLGSSSYTYNCHGYAWYITEGGSNVWIGYTSTNAEDIY